MIPEYSRERYYPDRHRLDIRNGIEVEKRVLGIRVHELRYFWACRELSFLKPGAKVVDLGCGCGYGTEMLGIAGYDAYGVDRDPAAIAYAKVRYSSLASFDCLDLETWDAPSEAAVCFDVLEHLDDPEALVKRLNRPLLVSVPANDPPSHNPFHKQQFDHRSLYELLRHYYERIEITHQSIGKGDPIAWLAVAR